MRHALALVCLCFVLLPGRAQAAEWEFTGMAGVTFLGNTTLIDLDNAAPNLHVNLGGAATFLTNGIIGAEGLTMWTPHFLKNGGSQLVDSGRTEAVMGNLVVTAPRRFTEYTLRPFVSGGLGLLRLGLSDQTPLLSYHANLTGLDIGGGAVGFLSTKIGVRFDVRYFRTLNRTDSTLAFGGTHLRYMTATVGIVYRR